MARNDSRLMDTRRSNSSRQAPEGTIEVALGLYTTPGPTTSIFKRERSDKSAQSLDWSVEGDHVDPQTPQDQ